MAGRYYLMPLTLQGPAGNQAYMPKYVSSLPAGTQWTNMDYGPVGHCLFYVDTDATTHAALAANVDVDQLPANIDTQLSAGAVTTVQTILENRNLPSQWVTTSLTYRDVLKKVAAVLQFMQRFFSYHGWVNPWSGGITLDSTYSSLPQTAKDNLLNAANSLGYSTAGITGASTIRQILKAVADQWTGPIYLGGVAL